MAAARVLRDRVPGSRLWSGQHLGCGLQLSLGVTGEGKRCHLCLPSSGGHEPGAPSHQALRNSTVLPGGSEEPGYPERDTEERVSLEKQGKRC